MTFSGPVVDPAIGVVESLRPGATLNPSVDDGPSKAAGSRPPIRHSARANYANVLLALSDQALVSGSNFLTAVILARTAGLSDLGIYSLALTVTVLLAATQEALILLPYTVYASRLSDADQLKCAGAALIQQMGLAAIGMVVLAALATIFGILSHDRLASEMWILTAAAPFLLLREFGRRMSFANLRLTEAFCLDLCVTVLLLSSVLLLAVLERLTAATMLMSLGAAAALGGCGWLFANRKRFVVEWASVQTEMRRNASMGGWSCLSRMTSVAESYTVHWLLAILIGARATGGFSACMAVVNLANPFLMGVGAILAPYAAQAYARDGAMGLKGFMQQANRWLIPPMIVFAAVLGILGQEILRFIYGNGMVHDGATIGILALAMLASTVGMGADNALRTLQRTKTNFIASVCALTASTTIALVTIGSWSSLGAACGLAAGSSINAAIRCVEVHRALKRQLQSES